ncbi:MAG: FAD-dependent oxidoreductase [Alphaproteobacteria bacterium]|nr:FAD-dependent oxidoreductase [Alphaproteobacteria bacterium]
MAGEETQHTGSYYAATANPAPERPALKGDAVCDICVIGAGFSGISAALHLAEKGHKVIVLEAVKVAFGASGRNGGQIINGYSRDYDTIKSRYGEDTARALLDMSFEGGDIIRARIEKYGIECDLKKGSFFAAFNDRQMKDLERRREVWAMAGHKDVEMLDKSGIPKVVDTDLYTGGMLDNKGGHIHPMNLVLGQAAALESLGGKIYEHSRVARIEHGAKPAAVTAQGKVTCNHLVICGNAYLGETVPELSARFMSVSSQIVTTEVLGAELTDKMMPGDNCLEDCNFLLDYYRITGDKRLLFGGGVVYSGSTPTDIENRLVPHIHRTFPHLKGKKIDFAWSGNFALTLTRMPHIGRLADNVWFIQGDSGHGVTPCHLLGRLTAEAIDNQQSRWDVFAKMKNYPFPGGRMFRVPLTAMGAWYYGMREKLGI